MANAVGTMTSSLTGTLVAICAPGQLDETRETLRALHARGGVRPIAVTFGDAPQPPVREVDGVTVIDGLLPRYLDNVVAARRVSSLPAMAWWRGGDAAVLDYAMIDDDYMLAPVAASYLLDSGDRAAARRFLAARLVDEGIPGKTEPAGAALVRNLRFVVAHAQPFATTPAVGRLIGLKQGRMTGEGVSNRERRRTVHDQQVDDVTADRRVEAGVHRSDVVPSPAPINRSARATVHRRPRHGHRHPREPIG